MQEWKFAVNQDFINSDKLSYDYYVLLDGKSAYGNETEEDFLAAGFTILTPDEFNALWRKKEESLIGDWQEEMEETYDYALNVLPPMHWVNGGFFVSEAYSGNVYAFHQSYDGKFYTSLQRISTPRTEIMDSLKAFVESKGA